MTRRSMICEPGAVVVVPFPFSDLPIAKPRPALTLSPELTNAETGQTLMAMITAAARSRWPNDMEISDLGAAGLRHASVVRWKLFTIDNRLIARVAGRLSGADREAAAAAARLLIGL
jgi:mRNA interferase MazF